MSTKPRIVVPGVFYLVSSKGVQNLDMFQNDELKAFFLAQLSKTLKKYSFTCYAFSITKNQYQMVLQSNQQSISDAMQQFNSIIARQVNKVLQRDGTVFATRFKSLIVESDQVKYLIRAVHLEPVKLGECTPESLTNYNWSSHSYYLKGLKTDLLNPDTAFKMFYKGSKENYSAFVNNEDYDSAFDSILKDVNCGKQGFAKPQMWIVGKPEFVKNVIELDRNRRLRIARHISENISIERIHEEVTRLLILDNNDLYRAGQLNVRSTARELFVFLCKQKYDFTGAETARHLKVTDSAVSKMVTRFINVENNLFLIQNVIEKIA